MWWLGQSGFLVLHDGASLLIDPYLSDSLTRKYADTETPHVRLTRRVVAPERLGFVDVVLSTHGHTDHLDEETLRAVGAPVVAPAGVVELARERSGADAIGVSEGTPLTVGGFAVEAVPAAHPGDHCVGYVLTAGAYRLYHSGDTTWIDPGVRDVDLAFVPINGKLNNLDASEAARLAQLVEARAGRAVPLRHVRVQHCGSERVRGRMRAPRAAVPRAQERRAPEPAAARAEVEPRAQFAEEGAVPRCPRQDDLRRAEKRGVRAQRGRELVDEAGLVQRLEAVLPPEAEHADRSRLALDPRLDPPDETVAPEQRQDVVAPAPLRLRDVDLPEIVEVPQAAQQVAVPDERVERGEERDPGDDGLGVGENCRFLGQDHPVALDTLDRDRQQQSVLDQLVAQPVALRRRARRADPDLLVPAAHPEQPVRAVPGQELVLQLLVLRAPLREQLGREQALREVVQAPVAVAAGDPEHARKRQRLEDRADLVRRAPVPVDRLAHLDVSGRQRPLLPDPLEQLGDELGVVVELAVPVRRRVAVPADPVVGQLRRRQQRQALVVGLVEPPFPVEQVIRPLSAVAVDARGEDEVVVAPGDVERVELERAEPRDDGLDRLRLGRQ